MEKLFYKNLANINVLIDLNNGYSVVAIGKYDNATSGYIITLWIKCNAVDRFDLMEDLKLNIKTHQKNHGFVKHEILKNVVEMNSKHEFDRYIERTEHELNCEY